RMIKSIRTFLWTRFISRRHSSDDDLVQAAPSLEAVDCGAAAVSPVADDVASLVDQMLTGGRYALLLRPQIADNLTLDLYQKAQAALIREMALVPQGEVHLEPSVFDVDYPLFVADDPDSPKGLTIFVQPVFLDRYPVTNKQYQRFVSAGGYQEMAIWEPE